MASPEAGAGRAGPRSRRVGRLSLITVLGAILLLLRPLESAAQSANPVPPPDGVWLGTSLVWDVDSPLEFSRRIGRASLLYSWFMALPLDFSSVEYLKLKILREPFPRKTANASSAQGDALITLEPIGGLATVTDTVIADVVAMCKLLNDNGVEILLRFAHEMNGDWYAWGIQPALYRSTFQRLATAIHAGANRTAMCWSPNVGVTYPYAEKSTAVPGTADFKELDTNGDGVVDRNDDPYGPFWPGDQYVDWVGMSLYWTGSPFGQNTIPFARDFYYSIHGRDPETGVNTTCPDFYAVYAVGKNKPMVVPETGAMHVPTRPGPGELDIKKAWWAQTVSAATLDEFPLLKGIILYEVTIAAPREFNVAVNISYANTLNQTIRDAFVSVLPYDRYTWGSSTAFDGYVIDTTPIAITDTKASVVQGQKSPTTPSPSPLPTSHLPAARSGGMSSSAGPGARVGRAEWLVTFALFVAAIIFA